MYSGIAERNARPTCVLSANDARLRSATASLPGLKNPRRSTEGIGPTEQSATNSSCQPPRGGRFGCWNTDTHCEDERHGHRTGRNSAGIECDAEKISIAERGGNEDQRITPDEQHPERRSRDYAEHADGHEESDTRADGYEKQARIDMRNGVRKAPEDRAPRRLSQRRGQS